MNRISAMLTANSSLKSRWSELLFSLRQFIARLFNLNDNRWGNESNAEKPGNGKDAPSTSDNKPETDVKPQAKPTQKPGSKDGPPDLDELWKDFNRKLSGLFGGKGSGPSGPSGGSNGGGRDYGPDMKSAGLGVGLVAGVALMLWLGTGFFIVQEGQQGVILQFGKYKTTVGAGFNWRFPYPIQTHEVVSASQLRSVEIGRGSVVKATALKESSMLTEDENIIDVRFAVQYRVKDAQEYLFNNREVEQTVIQASETAVREIVGKSKMDVVLYEGRERVAIDLSTLIQQIVDRYKTGVIIASVTMQNVQPPEQVQAAFDDAVKAGQDRERAKNEGQAYANDVIPRARGAAARLAQEADAHRSRVVATAEGDSDRFRQVLAEYSKAPGVTRDRMYIETMQQVYSNVSKVMVDSKQGSNLLYLPLDKIIQQASSDVNAARNSTPITVTPPPAPVEAAAGASANSPDTRSREALRNRDR
jgi:modulator of FtsH protease HflK